MLKRAREPRHVAYANLIAFLAEEWGAAVPTLVAKEAMLPLEAFRKIENAQSTVYLQAGLHAIVEGMAIRFGLTRDQVEDVADSTARKHFIGKGRLGSRNETKAAVVQRCHVMGLMPRDCSDDNRADAIAVHDWACATFFSRSTSMARLHLFGEEAAAS